MAFVSLLPLARRRASVSTAPCICMRKRAEGNKNKPKGFARPTSASASVAAGADSKLEADVASENGIPHASVNDMSELDTDNVVRQQGTGEGGDATPHRAVTSRRQKLKDPTRDLQDSGVEVEGAVLDVFAVGAERLGWKLTSDGLIEAFEDARRSSSSALGALVAANRHHVSEGLLYRFTSAILQAESQGRNEEAGNMRNLRKELIAQTWRLDLPFKRAILAAEQRMLATLQAPDVPFATKRQAGANQGEVNAFWVVCYAAVAAWEERGRQNEELSGVDIQRALADVAATYRDSEKLQKSLSPCLKAVGEVLTSKNPQDQATILNALSENDIAEFACFVEQIRLVPINAYDALRQRLQTILDFVIESKYSVKPLSISPLRFDAKPVDEDSNLVAIAQASSSNAFQIPSFNFNLNWKS